MTSNVVKIPEYYERPRRVFGVWTLRKNKRTAECSLWTHPIGGEIRVEVSGDEFVRSGAGRDGLALIDKAKEWRQQFEGNGWTARRTSLTFLPVVAWQPWIGI
jgi:hypothetical protein